MKLLLVLKKQSLFLSLLYTIALTVLSLITLDLDSIEDVVPSFSDKLFHFLAYALLTWLWFTTFTSKWNFPKRKAIISASLFAIAFGIIIEVLQKEITYSRGFDYEDILANTFGSLFTLLVLIFNFKTHVKNH